MYLILDAFWSYMILILKSEAERVNTLNKHFDFINVSIFIARIGRTKTRPYPHILEAWRSPAQASSSADA